MRGDIEDVCSPDGPGRRGYVFSTKAWSVLDGPGTRYLVCLSGCVLRCLHCSVPAFWELTSGSAESAEAVLAPVRRRTGFYSLGGGGVTLAGGDPLLQPGFVVDVFRRVHAMGLTTCLSTTGVAPRRAWDLVLPHTDHVLLSVKHFDRETARKIAGGVDCLPTQMEFLRVLRERGVRTWVQYALVPGLTDRCEDLSLICSYFGTLNRGNTINTTNIELLELIPSEAADRQHLCSFSCECEERDSGGETGERARNWDRRDQLRMCIGYIKKRIPWLDVRVDELSVLPEEGECSHGCL